jgi:hypothetical protein
VQKQIASLVKVKGVEAKERADGATYLRAAGVVIGNLVPRKDGSVVLNLVVAPPKSVASFPKSGKWAALGLVASEDEKAAKAAIAWALANPPARKGASPSKVTKAADPDKPAPTGRLTPRAAGTRTRRSAAEEPAKA